MKDTQDREELFIRLLMRTVGALVVILVAVTAVMVISLLWEAWRASPTLTVALAIGLAIAWELGARATKLMGLDDEDYK